MLAKTYINPIGYDVSSFLVAHNTLGTMYEPLMGLFVLLSVLSPIWLCYVFLCAALASIQHVIKKGTLVQFKPKLKAICIRLLRIYDQFYLFCRVSLDGLLNPTSLVMYPIITGYLYGGTPEMDYFTYINQFGQSSFYAKPYFAFAFVSYWVWVLLSYRVIKSNRQSYILTKHMITPFFSPSRVFGSAVIGLIIYDFSNTIDYLLWVNVYIGACIAIINLTIRLYRIYNLALIPQMRV